MGNSPRTRRPGRRTSRTPSPATIDYARAMSPASGAGGLRVGIVGLGTMGGRIARRVAAGRFDVYGFDLDSDRAGSVGVVAVASTLELAREVDVVLLSLPDSTVVEPVVRE